MDVRSDLYLPPEILLSIAQCCLDVFSDHELWFGLGQTSRLFRYFIETFVLANVPQPYPLLSRSIPWSLRSISERQKYTIWGSFGQEIVIGMRLWGDAWEMERFPFKGFDATDSRLALYQKVIVDEDDMKHAREMIRYAESSSSGQHDFNFFTVEDLEASSPELRESQQLEQGSTPQGEGQSPPPANNADGSHDSNDYGRQNDSQETRAACMRITLAFDWREMWTLKCLRERQVDRRRRRRSSSSSSSGSASGSAGTIGAGSSSKRACRAPVPRPALGRCRMGSLHSDHVHQAKLFR